jgi:hypothetical protein
MGKDSELVIAATTEDEGQAPADSDPVPGERSTVRRLLLASFLMLFLELALIRWLGANVVHLSYFSNFVLLGGSLARRLIAGTNASLRRSFREGAFACRSRR